MEELGGVADRRSIASNLLSCGGRLTVKCPVLSEKAEWSHEKSVPSRSDDSVGIITSIDPHGSWRLWCDRGRRKAASHI